MRGRHVAPSPSALRRRGLVAGVAVAGVVIVASGGGAASAAGPIAQGTGRYLGGTVLGTNLDAAASLAPATAQNTGTPASVTDVHPLHVTVLGAINLNLGGGVQIPLSDVLTLGAVNQVAQANNNGSSYAASGTVTNGGAIGVGRAGVPQSTASVTLDRLLPASVTSTIANLSLNVGALAATAHQAAPGTSPAPTGSYAITSLTANITSPLMAGAFTNLQATLSGLQPTVDGLQATISGIVPGATVSGLPNLVNLLHAISPVSVANGAITVNPFTGQLSIDVARLLTGLGLSIDTLPPNTDLLPYVSAALANPATGLLAALQNALAGLDTTITNALNGITITVGGVIVAPNAAVLAAIAAVDNQVLGPINTFSGNLGSTVVTPLVNTLSGVLSLVANGQSPSPPAAGSAFTETALQVNVLGAASAIQLNLAQASVGPNAGPPPPTAATLTPTRGPDAGGTTITITGTDFVPGATTVSIGGITVPANRVTVNAAGTSLSFVTPPHAAGPVGVTVSTAGGTSTPPLTYTYLPAPPAITSPANGASVSTPTPPISGTGTAGDTVTVRENGTVLCSATVASDGTWTCTPSAPLGNGTHTILATQTDRAGDVSPNSATVTFTVAVSSPSGLGASANGIGGGSSGVPALTGSDLLPPLGAGLLLTALGLILLLAARRRRS